MWKWTVLVEIFVLQFVFRRVRKISKATTCLVMSVRPSVHMGNLDFHWTDFRESWYMSIFRITVEKMKVSLKSDKNSGFFTWRPIRTFVHISLISS